MPASLSKTDDVGPPQRVAWVDHAKGICILLVVMLHAATSVEYRIADQGWVHSFIAFAKPFRMPDFFMISGLFVARVLDRPWRDYLDRKVVHFMYFYALWVTLQMGLRGIRDLRSGGALEEFLANYAMAFVQPYGTLWFIYMLPVFMLVVRLVRAVPAPFVLAVAALLEMCAFDSGWKVIDSFAERFVYFYAGYWFAPKIFQFAGWARQHVPAAISLLLGWAIVNGLAVATDVEHAVGVSLALGGMGAVAVIVFSALLSRSSILSGFRYLGEHSLVVYLSAFLPIAAARLVLFQVRGVYGLDVSTIILLMTTAGVIMPLLVHRLILWLGRGRWLFRRPAWAQIVPYAGATSAQSHGGAKQLPTWRC